VKVGDEVVPWFQLASMAQTRAGAKALRNRLAWVVVLAGYKPTPAEEMTEGTASEAQKERRTVDKAQHYCQIHGVNFFKKGRMKGYAHPIEGTDKWCNEDDIKPEPSPEAPQERTEQATQPPDEETQPEPQAEEQVDPIDLVWLKETLGYIHWKESTALTWIFSQFKVPIKGSLAEVLKSLKPNAVNEFYYHIKSVREARGH